MKAIGYQQPLPINDPLSLQDIELLKPQATGRDLLVEIKAISVNPVDTKIRRKAAAPPEEWKVLGWDAAGVVKVVGEKANLFAPGDKVWYAGDITRQGSNAEYQLVDERIVGKLPDSLGFAEAAALPLTSITAWEMLFDRMGLQQSQQASGESLLIIGAGGGVGSIMVQLACQLTGLTVIGSASRDETREWVQTLGAHHVIDHSKPLSQELKRIGRDNVTHVAGLTHTDQHYAEIVEAIAPQGQFCLIDDPGPIDVTALKRKSVSLHWEFMFTRSMFHTNDMIAQHELLNRVAVLIDEGAIRTTLGQHLGAINAPNLRRAHAQIESHRTRGKIVLEGFG